MSEKFEHIDQLFKDELGSFAPDLPAGAWDNIAAGIAAKPTKKILPLFWKIAASIALLISTGLVLYNILDKNSTKVNPIAESVILESSEVSNLGVSSIKTDKNLLKEDLQNQSTLNKNITSKSTTNKTDQPFSHVSNYQKNITQKQIDNKGPIPVASGKSGRKNIILSHANRIIALVPSTALPEDIIDNTKQEEDKAWFAAFNEYEELATNDAAKNNPSKWMLGGQAGPQYAYREISSEYMTQDLLESYNEREENVVAYAGGINIEFSPAKRLSIQSGIYYSKMGLEVPSNETNVNQNLSYSAVFSPENVNDNSVAYKAPTSIGNIVFYNTNSNISESRSDKYYVNNYSAPAANDASANSNASSSSPNSFSQYFEYLEVPIIARYAVIDRKFGVHLLGGVSTNFLIGNSVYVNNSSESVGYTDDVTKINYSATAGFGVGYEMSKHLEISLEPQFKYYINEMSSGIGIEAHPYSLGIMTGVKYLF